MTDNVKCRDGQAFNNYRYSSEQSENDPPEVKKAQLLIERHNEKERKSHDLRMKVIKKERNRLAEILLFSTPEKALAEIKKFETMEFK